MYCLKETPNSIRYTSYKLFGTSCLISGVVFVLAGIIWIIFSIFNQSLPTNFLIFLVLLGGIISILIGLSALKKAKFLI